MKRLNLLNIDLNLLVAFDALVIEGSVSRAANRVGVSQPAMSRSLKQLRDMFGDVLFRRTSDGMVPTPRAAELARQIRPNLENIAAALGQRMVFNPVTAVRRFVIAMPDMAAALALPSIVRKLNAVAPGIDLTIVNTGNRESLHKVECGQAEMALGVYEQLLSGIRSTNLRTLREICIADPANPMLQNGEMDLKAFLSSSHVAVSMNEDFGTPIDTVLETLGHRRRIAVATPFFVSVPRLVNGTSMIAVVVEELLNTLPETEHLMRFPVPVALEPVMSKLIWHARSDEDPGHSWLRDIIVRSASL